MQQAGRMRQEIGLWRWRGHDNRSYGVCVCVSDNSKFLIGLLVVKHSLRAVRTAVTGPVFDVQDFDQLTD